jgi:hypothetical protein
MNTYIIWSTDGNVLDTIMCNNTAEAQLDGVNRFGNEFWFVQLIK